jgi:hypothetical protein
MILRTILILVFIIKYTPSSSDLKRLWACSFGPTGQRLILVLSIHNTVIILNHLLIVITKTNDKEA